MQTTNNIEVWVLILTGLPGLFALVYQVISAIISRRKLPSEIGKTHAETSKITGEAYQGLIDDLQEQISILKVDLDNAKKERAAFTEQLKTEKTARISLQETILELKEKQAWYERYIDTLHAQLMENGIVPEKRPEQISLG